MIGLVQNSVESKRNGLFHTYAVDIHFRKLYIHKQVVQVIHAEGCRTGGYLITGENIGLGHGASKGGGQMRHIEGRLGRVYTRLGSRQIIFIGAVRKAIIGTFGIIVLGLLERQISIRFGNLIWRTRDFVCFGLGNIHNTIRSGFFDQDHLRLSGRVVQGIAVIVSFFKGIFCVTQGNPGLCASGIRIEQVIQSLLCGYQIGFSQDDILRQGCFGQRCKLVPSLDLIANLDIYFVNRPGRLPDQGSCLPRPNGARCPNCGRQIAAPNDCGLKLPRHLPALRTENQEQYNEH